jgi:hypothetical protein
LDFVPDAICRCENYHSSFLILWNAHEVQDRRQLTPGFCNNNPLTLTSGTAKEAFAKAIEWHIIERFTNVSISDGIQDYTISEFASLMALREIDHTMSRK